MFELWTALTEKIPIRFVITSYKRHLPAEVAAGINHHSICIRSTKPGAVVRAEKRRSVCFAQTKSSMPQVKFAQWNLISELRDIGFVTTALHHSSLGGVGYKGRLNIRQLQSVPAPAFGEFLRFWVTSWFTEEWQRKALKSKKELFLLYPW